MTSKVQCQPCHSTCFSFALVTSKSLQLLNFLSSAAYQLLVWPDVLILPKNINGWAQVVPLYLLNCSRLLLP